MTDTGASAAERSVLELNAEQRLALEAIIALFGFLRERQGVQSGLARQTLTAAGRAVSNGLPKCPFAPPNHGITTKFDLQNNMHLECDHSPPDGGPHCWDAASNQKIVCP